MVLAPPSTQFEHTAFIQNFNDKTTVQYGAVPTFVSIASSHYDVARQDTPEEARTYVVFPRALGKGAFSVVYLGCNQETGQKVAIKNIHASRVQKSPEAVEREIEIHQKLDHPRIPKLLDYWMSDAGDVSLAMEYIPGCNLLTYLRKRRRLSENEARSIFLQILETVKYCHLNDIVHRDLKLDNIVLNERDGEIKLIDFGFAESTTDQNRRVKCCGSLYFMPPELLNQQHHGTAADVWSLGCLLYSLVFGTYPFLSDNKMELIRRIRCADFEIPDNIDVSEELKQLIYWMLCVEPSQRPTVADIMSHPWFYDLFYLQ